MNRHGILTNKIPHCITLPHTKHQNQISVSHGKAKQNIEKKREILTPN
jgi:hypothetical protein